MRALPTYITSRVEALHSAVYYCSCSHVYGFTMIVIIYIFLSMAISTKMPLLAADPVTICQGIPYFISFLYAWEGDGIEI
jgi:hypothetical protein